MLRQGSIYVLIDYKNEIRYVGQTIVNPNRRLYLHYYAGLKSARTDHVTLWLAQQMRRGTPPKMEVVCTINIDDLDKAEQYWISYYKSIGCDLVNIHSGGNGGWRYFPDGYVSPRKGVKLSETQKKAISNKLTGRSLPESTKEKMKLARQRDRSKISQKTKEAWASGKLASHWTNTDKTPIKCIICGKGPYAGATGLKIHRTISGCAN